MEARRAWERVMSNNKEQNRFNHAEDMVKLRNLVKEIDYCMLTTICEDGTLVSRPMSSNKNIEFDGDLWFFTYGDSHKVMEAESNPQVNVAFADIKKQSYVSISGTAQLVRDKEKIQELWQPEYKIYFPDGVDTPDIALLKVTAHKAEFWDAPNSLLSHALAMFNVATGKPVDLGENKCVNLDVA